MRVTFHFRFIILIPVALCRLVKKGRVEVEEEDDGRVRDRCFQRFTSQTNSGTALQFRRFEPIHAPRPPLIPNLQNVTVNRPVSPFLLITRVSALIASRPVQRARFPLIDPLDAQRNRTKQSRAAEFNSRTSFSGYAKFSALSFSLSPSLFFLKTCDRSPVEMERGIKKRTLV